MHVPEFMIDFIIGLSPTSDPRKTGTEFIPTLAGYVSQLDIFRLPSPSMFLHAHHLLATTRANIDPTVLMNQWYDTTFFTVATNATTYSYKIANFFGTNYDDSSSCSTHSNWLNSCVNTLFNPVVGRSLAARPTYRPHPVHFPSYTTFDMNPYFHYLLADNNNIFNTVHFIDEISGFFKNETTSTIQLGAIFSKTSGISLLTHALSEPALPTWHVLNVKSSPTDVPSHKTDKEFATKISFLTEPSYSPKLKLKYPTDDSVIEKIFYLIRKGKHDDKNSPDTFITFNPNVHVYPRTRYFDPYDYSPSKLAYTVMNGILIETFEIDGFSIPNVNLRSSLDEENSQFLQSAIRSGCLQYATSTSGTFAIKRTVTRSDRQKVSLGMFNFARTRLPHFDEDTSDSTMPTSLSGFRAVPHVRSTSLGSNHYGYHAEALHDTPRPVKAWSSYRFVSTQASTLNQHVFFLLSFRTSYGTNVTMSESSYPAFLLPN